MTEENKIVKVKNECFCQSKGFRKFLITALGTFVGVYCALSLFAALHRPPMPFCPFAHHMKRPPIHHNYARFEREPRADFHYKKIMKHRIAPDKVNVEVKG